MVRASDKDVSWAPSSGRVTFPFFRSENNSVDDVVLSHGDVATAGAVQFNLSLFTSL